MVTIQKYVKAQSLEEAWKLNQGKKNRILGGMLWMRLGNGTISTAIDLCDLGLDTIEETDEEFSIGARVTLRELEQHTGDRPQIQYGLWRGTCAAEDYAAGE